MMQLKSSKADIVMYIELVRICSLAVLAFTIVRGLRPEIFQALEFKMMPLWKVSDHCPFRSVVLCMLIRSRFHRKLRAGIR